MSRGSSADITSQAHEHAASKSTSSSMQETTTVAFCLCNNFSSVCSLQYSFPLLRFLWVCLYFKVDSCLDKLKAVCPLQCNCLENYNSVCVRKKQNSLWKREYVCQDVFPWFLLFWIIWEETFKMFVIGNKNKQNHENILSTDLLRHLPEQTRYKAWWSQTWTFCSQVSCLCINCKRIKTLVYRTYIFACMLLKD